MVTSICLSSVQIFAGKSERGGGERHRGQDSGQVNGQVHLEFPNGGQYKGNLQNGQRSGQGTFSGDRMCDGIYTFSTGQTLQGHFERGLPSGKMIYTDHGISYNTTWSNGICVGITIA